MLRLKLQHSGHLMWRADSLKKTPMPGKTGGRRRGATEDEMVGWHHQLNGHEFEQAPGDGEGQGSLACCSPWGCKGSDTTERLNTKVNTQPSMYKYLLLLFSELCIIINPPPPGQNKNFCLGFGWRHPATAGEDHHISKYVAATFYGVDWAPLSKHVEILPNETSFGESFFPYWSVIVWLIDSVISVSGIQHSDSTAKHSMKWSALQAQLTSVSTQRSYDAIDCAVC